MVLPLVVQTFWLKDWLPVNDTKACETVGANDAKTITIIMILLIASL